MASPTPEQKANLANQMLHIKDDRGPELIALNVILPLLAVIAVILRVIARRMTRMRLSWDDYIIFASLFILLVQVVINVFLIRVGIGKHVVAVGIPNVVKYLRLIYVYVCLYSVSFPLSKLSILLLYRRVFKVPSFQRTVNIVFAFFLAFYIAQIFAVIFPCKPISFFWTQAVDPTTGKCVNIQYLYYSVNVINIITDIVLLTLPIHKIWQLQMAIKQKIAICGIFLLGSFVTVCSVVRVVYLGGVVSPEAQIDATWNSTDESIWVLVECCLGVICACLPVMWPIIRKVVPDPWITQGSGRKRYSSNAYRVGSSDKSAAKSNGTVDSDTTRVFDGDSKHVATKTAEGGAHDLETGVPANGIYVKRDFEMS